MKLSFINRKKEEDFSDLYNQYFAPFCIFANKFIHDISVCEDLVSDVFVSIWYKMEKDELLKETALAYIKMAVRNSCLNFIKHQEYEQAYMEKYLNEKYLFTESPENIYTLNELYEQLNDILNTLPEQYKTVFIKSFFGGKTYAEIAEEMNLSTKSVNRYKQKTILHLREELKEYISILILFCILEQTMLHLEVYYSIK